MGKWMFKSCPRCSGDVFIEKDMYGWYEQCLQCAYRRELKNLAEFQGQPVPAGGTSPQKSPVS